MGAGYYPIYIDMREREVLVVGGGSVALRKVRVLREHGAVVRIVAPEIVDELKAMIDGCHCIWEKKEYAAGMIGDAWMVFSCTQREELNRQIAQDAWNSRCLVNVVDNPEQCSFIVPAILERGPLSIAVSTSGKSPLAARQIRDELGAQYGEEMGVYLELLGEWRQRVKQSLTVEQRARFWTRTTDGEVRSLVKEGRILEAKGVVEKCFQSLLA
ncbi:MAG: bifunctional precorrin-2 dehydrogenase/sirohydrochlorin ferrochelatase [Peptococcaceae bacterium]|nr:bifunctional precorrin-2 dehydrogenase/sirohydrochlorin ferrochelatase [Peptococcaceae bacterium]